jgi:hypothetical protein
MGNIILLAMAWDTNFTIIILPMLKLDTKYVFHELYLSQFPFVFYLNNFVYPVDRNDSK